MSIILEVWDIHERNARIINYSLTKKFILKRFFILWTLAAQFSNSFVCILDINFTDPVKSKNNKRIIGDD